MPSRGEVRSWIYNRALVGLTEHWYRQLFERLPDGARMLDVGVATGGALVRCADVIQAHDLHITGVDIDAEYTAHCRREIDAAGLGSHVDAKLESVYDHTGGPYDVVYFGASLMLMPDQVGVLRHVGSLLAPGGRIMAAQTFHHRRSPVKERLKPLLRHVTSIEFGSVTYEADFRRVFTDAGVELVEFTELSRTRTTSYCLATGRPVPARQEAGESTHPAV